jgi:hypothetical protein
MADDSKKSEHNCPRGGGDVIHVGPDLGGFCPFVRHRADHTIESGMAKIVRPGDPPTTEAPLLLTHREGSDFDVQVMSKGGNDAPTKGPVKVNSPAFKTGWDNIFGKKAPVGQA